MFNLLKYILLLIKKLEKLNIQEVRLVLDHLR
nr:MAG TPA: hypothetical protein [Caudoviricetes sp.]